MTKYINSLFYQQWLLDLSLYSLKRGLTSEEHSFMFIAHKIDVRI